MAAPASSAKRIVFTGGSGIVGRHVVNELLNYGHKVLNVDQVPSVDPRIHTIRADPTHSGQAFNCLSSHFKLTQPFVEPLKTPDAVIHFAGVPRNMLVTDGGLLRINTQSAYNEVEAAAKLGIKKIILAKSVTVYGVTFAEGNIEYPSFPIDEMVDCSPMDTYASSKLCMETIARMFARRSDIDVYDPVLWKARGWSYVDVRDLGQMCHRAVEVDGLGFQIFNATNDEITGDTPTEDFLKATCPNIPLTRAMGKREAPMSNLKIKELLGFQEQHPW